MTNGSDRIADEIRRRVNVANKLDSAAIDGDNSDISEAVKLNGHSGTMEGFSGKSSAEKISLRSDGDEQDRVDKGLSSLDNRIVDRFVADVRAKEEDGKSKGSLNSKSKIQVGDTSSNNNNEDGQRIANNDTNNVAKIQAAIINRQNDTKGTSDNPTAENTAASDASSARTADSSSTEPVPAESKVIREFTSRRMEENFPFVTTVRGSNVVTTTTSRSTKVEEVTVYDGDEEDEEEDTSEEVRENI